MNEELLKRKCKALHQYGTKIPLGQEVHYVLLGVSPEGYEVGDACWEATCKKYYNLIKPKKDYESWKHKIEKCLMRADEIKW